MSESKAFKDYFDVGAVKRIAEQLASAWPPFDRCRFIELATANLEHLELSGRVRQISRALEQTLPSDVPAALEILTRSLPDELPGCEAVTDGFLLWPIGQFIADNGLDYFDESMRAMTELTKRFSSEFAVRPFVEHQPGPTFDRLLALCDDPNPHVRRWCSEGTRPRLPWGNRLRGLIADPAPIFPILEALKDDPEPYVRRSVANNLNDIAKDHPGEVLALCKRWSADASGERRWVIKRALRTLVKDGHPEALALIGFAGPKGLSATLRIKPGKVTIGEHVVLETKITTSHTRRQKLLVDYVVHYVRADGSSSAKVFKWTTASLSPREVILLSKKHPMKRTTIRALYPGRHRVEVQVNGCRVAAATFLLAG